MLAEFTSWLLGLVVKVFTALWSFLTDVFINAVELFVNAVVGLVSLIPIPDFMRIGLQSIYAQLDPGIAYLLTVSGLPLALTIIGTGYLFRIGRKVVTLFQW